MPAEFNLAEEMRKAGLNLHKPVPFGSNWWLTQFNQGEQFAWWDCLTTPRYFVGDGTPNPSEVLKEILKKTLVDLWHGVKNKLDTDHLDYVIPFRVIVPGGKSIYRPAHGYSLGTYPTFVQNAEIGHDKHGICVTLGWTFHAFVHISKGHIWRPGFTAVTPKQMLAEATEIAKDMLSRDDLDRRLILSKLREESPMAHALVKHEFAELRRIALA